MSKFVTVVMYLLWVVALAVAVAATLTDFKYEDLNLMALVFFAFALLNSFFVLTKK